MEKLFILGNGSKKDVWKLNELLDAGYHIGTYFDWPDAKVFILFKDSMVDDDESERWKSGAKDDDEEDK